MHVVIKGGSVFGKQTMGHFLLEQFCLQAILAGGSCDL